MPATPHRRLELAIDPKQPEDADPPSTEVVDPGADNAGLENGSTRRAFVRRGGKLLIYSAPLVQLFRPSKAFAASPGLSGLT